MIVSIETPVFKGGWLIPCIESVLNQTSPDWEMSMVWDGGDALSRNILEEVERLQHPKITVCFEERKGIARARRFLSGRSRGDYILPLDDDDMLASDAVERLLAAATRMPWAGIIRARRKFIDEEGEIVDMAEWFPFESRHYHRGMVTDLFNHCQPYLIRRAAYEKTAGWEGFEDFMQAGEDCDIFTKIEEVAPVELLDECLYYYRLNSQRASHELKPEGAYEMWRRLADKTIERIGLPLRRANERQPFTYLSTADRNLGPAAIDVIIPFFEADEEELDYAHSRPKAGRQNSILRLDGRFAFRQRLDPGTGQFDRLELVAPNADAVHGVVRVVVAPAADPGSPIAAGEYRLAGENSVGRTVSIAMQRLGDAGATDLYLKISLEPDRRNRHDLQCYLGYPDASGKGEPALMMRLYRNRPGHHRARLERCLASLRNCGIAEDAIHVVERRQSAAANRNLGFRATTRPLVCYMDDDVELTDKGVLDRLCASLAATESDLISPKILDPQGRIFCADPYFNHKQMPVPRGLGQLDEGQFDYESEVAWLPSTMLLVRREVVTAVAGFDDDYPASQMEDVDFCLKARRRDFKCLYSGLASAVHYNYQRNYNFALNFQYFSAKWQGHPELFEVPAAAATAVRTGVSGAAEKATAGLTVK